MRVLGVITARGGSKRIPQKNIKLLSGLPLISYVINAAKSSCVDRLIVSTDDPDISSIAIKYGAEVPFKRPADISEDVPSEDVVMHALNWAENDENDQYDIVVTMQPTTPFVSTHDINACVEMIKDKKFASCFSSVQISEPPEWMFRVGENGGVTTFMAGELKGDRGVVQLLEKLVIPNGGVYATRKSELVRQKALIAVPTSTVEMSRYTSVDIDEPIDWVVAEAIAGLLIKK